MVERGGRLLSGGFIYLFFFPLVHFSCVKVLDDSEKNSDILLLLASVFDFIGAATGMCEDKRMDRKRENRWTREDREFREHKDGQ